MSENDSPLTKSITLTMKIDKHHPSLCGHFPGNPIVPGVVILDHLIQLWQEEHRHTIKKILNAKFVNLLRPDIVCSIQYTPKTQQKIDFVVTTSNEHKEEATPTIICKGLFSYE